MIASGATRDLRQAKNRAEKLAIGEVAQLRAPLSYDVSFESPPHRKRELSSVAAVSPVIVRDPARLHEPDARAVAS